MNRILAGGGLLEGGESAGAFGDQYEYRFRQTEGYNDFTSPKYTEFIEVEFREAVYPVAIELGSPRGAGHVVSLKVITASSIQFLQLRTLSRFRL